MNSAKRVYVFKNNSSVVSATHFVLLNHCYLNMKLRINSKVAAITGAAQGLGFQIAKKLFQKGLKGLALLDIDEKSGKTAEEQFKREFGSESCVFIKTDVSQPFQFSDAFKDTIQHFKQLDIVINNASVIAEINWERCLLTNLGGCINGTTLAIDYYLPKYKIGTEGVIINIASILGLKVSGVVPIYTATKHGIVALSRAYGTNDHYRETNVRVIAVCPGNMPTAMTSNLNPDILRKGYQERFTNISAKFPLQSTEFVAESIATIIENGKNGSVWVIENEQPAYEIKLRKRYDMCKN